QRRYDSVRIHLADEFIAAFGNEEVARRVDCHTRGPMQFRVDRRATVSGKTCLAVAGHSRDDSLGADLAHTIAELICDEQVARTVHRQPAGPVELRLDGWPAVAELPGHARVVPDSESLGRTGQYRNVAVGIHLADALLFTLT